MKKIIFIAFLLAVCIVRTSAEVVDVNVAADIASRFFGCNVKVFRHVPKLHSLSDSAIVKHPSYYIFVNEDKDGFVIVSADNAVQPILAYGDNTILEDVPDAMQIWLDDIDVQIEKVRELQFQPTEEVCKMWRTVKIGTPVVLLETAKWNQMAPYNNECPKKNGIPTYTGCVCTAYAILMKYYGFPISGKGITPAYVTATQSIEVPERDLNHFYNWGKMPADGVFKSEEEKEEVAKLMADIGAAIQADYGTDATAAGYGKPEITQYFNYSIGSIVKRSHYTDSEWHSMLQTELQHQRPVLYRGDNEGTSGHAFILDGYTADKYYHVNWGWGGSYNGYFLLDALTPSDENYSKNQMSYLCSMPLELFNGEAVAQVGEMGCPDVQTAFALSDQTGEKTAILKNCSLKKYETTIREGFNVVVDLNGYNVDLKESLWLYGSLSIEDSKGTGAVTLSSNGAVINNYGDLTISGGTFKNTCQTVDDTDYRRVIWSDEESTLHISDGKFELFDGSQCLYVKGKTSITGGEFIHRGNGSVIYNACITDSLLIDGGYFLNSCEDEYEKDYRRVFSSKDKTNTLITGGTFEGHFSDAIVVWGNVDIKNAMITAPKQYACIEAGNAETKMTIQDCFVCGGKADLYSYAGTIEVLTGYFSRPVQSKYLAEGSTCQSNNDVSTNETYKYVVTNPNVPNGVEPVYMPDMPLTIRKIYTPEGVEIPHVRKGINILVDETGNIRKIFVK